MLEEAKGLYNSESSVEFRDELSVWVDVIDLIGPSKLKGDGGKGRRYRICTCDQSKQEKKIVASAWTSLTWPPHMAAFPQWFSFHPYLLSHA
jgi:hypothetical protein